MSQDLGKFLAAVAAHWWLWAVAAIIVGDQLLRAASVGYRGATDRVVKPGLRASLALVAAVIAALAGGYAVYEDAQARLADTEKKLAEAVVLRPELKTLETTTERQPDGTYKISKLVEIASRYPPSALHITVTAKGITELKIEPQSKHGMMIHGPSSQSGDTITDRIQGPVGKYLLIIFAASADVTLTHRFE
ncbi:MAG TPA: hypothetical protein VMV26_10760 [Alphaproteobacteria bacterium]|jgi:hypothetical protein|nr:hypothetical protein [Alphaproteobacteria bacterium]